MIMKDKTGIYFSIFAVLLLILFLILASFLVKKETQTTPRAKETTNVTTSYSTKISIDNSYIFASPVRASAGGDLIRVTVFLLDQNGEGVFDQTVFLKGVTGINIKEVQTLTDETGKAIFDIGSSSPGSFELTANVSGIELPQKVRLIFD